MDLLQRDVVMDLKAKSKHRPKAKGLRTLKCMGVFKDTNDKAEYGFVYRYPEEIGSDPTTLLQQLVKAKDSKDRPLLDDKFHFAFALADFLMKFHTTGWLYENFHSHNVLLFKPPRPAVLSPGTNYANHMWLHKSRPDGSFWRTDGPSADADMQDYCWKKITGTPTTRHRALSTPI